MDTLHINPRLLLVAGVTLFGMTFAEARLDDYKAYRPQPARALRSSGVMFESHQERGLWTTALIASAAVGFVGVATKDSNLAFAGFGCAFVSGVEVFQSGMRMSIFDRGLDLMTTGPVSFGFDPMAREAEPGVYLKATFKF